MDKAITPKNTAGVSIVEIMISLVLVAIGLMAITSTFPSINKNRKGVQEADQAKILATQVLEGLQFLTVNGTCPTTLSTAEKKECDDFLDKYQGKDIKIGVVDYHVSDWTGSGTPLAINDAGWGGKTVTVTVRWIKANKGHHISITGAL